MRTKPQLIEAVQKKLAAFPGVIFNYTQPAEDAVDEAETGLKSALAVKIFGQDLKTLEDKATQVKDILHKMPGITEVTVVRELGQPSLTITPDRAKLARYGLNVSDVNTMVETAMGGAAATKVIQGERQFDLVVRMQEPFRSDENAIRNLLIATPDGQHLPLSQFCDIRVENGASFIYRESNSRYIGVQFSVEGRDLASAVGEARRKVDAAVKLPIGYKFDWGGEYKEYLASQEQMKVILPLTVLLILTILFFLYGNLKFPLIIFFSVLVTEPVGGLLALYVTAHQFQRLFHARFRRPDGRRRADQRHSLLVHQQAAPGRHGYPLRHARSLAAAPAPHHDDRAGRLLRPAARGHVHRHRQRFAEARSPS